MPIVLPFGGCLRKTSNLRHLIRYIQPFYLAKHTINIRVEYVSWVINNREGSSDDNLMYDHSIKNPDRLVPGLGKKVGNIAGLFGYSANGRLYVKLLIHSDLHNGVGGLFCQSCISHVLVGKVVCFHIHRDGVNVFIGNRENVIGVLCIGMIFSPNQIEVTGQ